MHASHAKPLSVVIVSGLSGGGKASILRALEDVGYEAVDNPPLTMLEAVIARGNEKLALGIDVRTRDFDASDLLATIARLRADPAKRIQFVYAWADESTLLRRYTESRRRHPLAPQGAVADGIAMEVALTEPLREHSDLVVDTSGMPIADLRRLIQGHFGADSDQAQLIVSLVSFAYPRGLPREADLVFDARFLRNPHYDPILKLKTGIDPDVGAYVEADPDFKKFFSAVTELVDLVLPRFVQEGKKYATITIGCTGGRHRSVHLIEKLANHLTSCGAVDTAGGRLTSVWRVSVTHRELVRMQNVDATPVDHPVAHRVKSDLDKDAQGMSVQAQEA